MIEPEKVTRGGNGCWTHSGVAAALARHREEDITNLPAAEGMEFKFVEFLFDAPSKLQNLYEAGTSGKGSEKDMNRAVRGWQPTPPKGDGWFLISIHDTDNGPCACFTRERAEVNQKRVA